MMLLLLLLTAISTIVTSNPSVRVKRLIGSNTVTIEQYPYHVAIEINGICACGGAIISKQVVLTAAHCLRYNQSLYTIRSGTSEREAGGSIHHVVNRVLHELYSVDHNTNSMFDIGLAYVQEPFICGDARAIIGLYDKVLSEDQVLNDEAVVTGWGFVGPKGPSANVLQALRMPLAYSKNFCDDNYKEFGGIYEGQICAGYYNVPNKDVCRGDSGGALVLHGRVLGLLAYSEGGCGKYNYLPIFTEVAFFLDWIKKHVDLSNACHVCR